MSHNLRTYSPPENWDPENVRLSSKESHHLKDVLRIRKGDTVEVFDGAGRSCAAVVSGDDVSELDLIGESRHSLRSFESILIQAIPKAKRMEVVVEKATELGVAAILPFVCDRTVVKLSRKQMDKRLDRWRRIAISAAKQSGVDMVPDIRNIEMFDRVLCSVEQDCTVLIGSLEPNVEHIRSVLRSRRRAGVKKIGIIIGPEGDFTPGEMRLAKDAGAAPVGFGTAVLRTDTAAIYALSAITYEFSGLT